MFMIFIFNFIFTFITERWWIMFSNAGQNTTHDCQRAFLGGIADRLSSYTVIAIVWVMSLLMALPPLFGWSYYAPEDNGIRLELFI